MWFFSKLSIEPYKKDREFTRVPKTTQYQQPFLQAMATPQFSTYPNLGVWAKETLHYQQAVKIGSTIKISGQGSPSSIRSHSVYRSPI
jgi:hypothetical protein